MQNSKDSKEREAFLCEKKKTKTKTKKKGRGAGNNRMEKTRELFKKIRDIKGTFHPSC